MAEGQGNNQKPEIELPPNNYDPPSKKPVFPKGVFRKNNRLTVNSKDPGGFPNAKATSMLEKGYKKKEVIYYLGKGNSGLFVPDDGQEVEVSVEEGIHMKDGKPVFTFKDTSGNVFDVPYKERWDFYTRTKPVPFVPRSRSRMQRQRQTRKQRGQKGGFYPSVYRGIAGATMLTPLIARQMMRMYEQHGYKPLATRGETANKTRKRKSKKLSRNKRA